MKKITIALFLLGAVIISKAQKIAHVNFDSLVSLMPETKTVKDLSEKFMGDLKKTMSEMDKELQTKYADYLANKDKMADLTRKAKEDDLQSLQRRIEEYNQQAEMEYQKKIGELTAPIIEKAKKAIEAAAKEMSYKYVFDMSGNILYSEPSDDLLSASKKKLEGMPLANIPGNGPAKNDQGPKVKSK